MLKGFYAKAVQLLLKLLPSSALSGADTIMTTATAQTVSGIKTHSAAIRTSVDVGAVAGTGVALVENGDGVVHKTVFTLTNVAITMTDAGAAGCHGSQKIYDFPEGNIYIFGATTNLTTAAGAGGIADGAAVVGSIGTVAVAADNATLTGTEADIIPSTGGTLTAGAGVLKGKSVTATGAVFDGTGTAKDAILNFAVPDADSSASDTLTVGGTITILWANLGDN